MLYLYTISGFSTLCVTTQILILINLKYSVKRLVVLSTLKVESQASQFIFLYISLTIERTPFFFNSLTHNSLNPILKICPRTLQQVDSYRYWFNCLTQNQTLHIMYSRRMRVKWMTTKFNSGWFATRMQTRTKSLTASQHLRVQILGTLYQWVQAGNKAMFVTILCLV